MFNARFMLGAYLGKVLIASSQKLEIIGVGRLFGQLLVIIWEHNRAISFSLPFDGLISVMDPMSKMFKNWMASHKKGYFFTPNFCPNHDLTSSFCISSKLVWWTFLTIPEVLFRVSSWTRIGMLSAPNLMSHSIQIIPKFLLFS